MNYRKEYYKVIEDIKYKLSKIFLNRKIYDKYMDKLTEVTLMITKDSDEFVYYEAFLKLMAIEKSLDKYIDTHPETILPSYETETYLKDTINKKSREIKQYKNKLTQLKTRIVSCALTGSILITAGAYTILNEKDMPKEKLYLTNETTYYDNTDSVRHHSSYEKESKEEVIIKMITPWLAGEKEATREIRTYHISNMTYNEILSSKDYQNIINNLAYEERIDTMPLKTLNGVFQYDEPIYEVTEITQDQGKYIEKKPIIAKETIIAIFAELLVYLLVLKINDGPLFEAILKGANDVNSTEKLINSKRTTLKVLKKQLKQMTF